MKISLYILILALCGCNIQMNTPQTNNIRQVVSNKSLPDVTITNMPQTIDEFSSLSQQNNTPEGTVAMTIVAMWIYAEDQDLGQKAMSVIAHPEVQNPGQKGVNGVQLRNIDLQRMKDRIKGKRYMPQSYFKGTTPPQYNATAPYTVETFTNPHSNIGKGALKVMVYCNGAASPRPVTVQPSNGVWKVKEWSSLLSAVKN